jgi:hypothetical protein
MVPDNSFYACSDGLRKEELLAAIRTLLKLGSSAQEAYYQEWFVLAEAGEPRWPGMPA